MSVPTRSFIPHVKLRLLITMAVEEEREREREREREGGGREVGREMGMGSEGGRERIMKISHLLYSCGS